VDRCGCLRRVDHLKAGESPGDAGELRRRDRALIGSGRVPNHRPRHLVARHAEGRQSGWGRIPVHRVRTIASATPATAPMSQETHRPPIRSRSNSPDHQGVLGPALNPHHAGNKEDCRYNQVPGKAPAICRQPVAVRSERILHPSLLESAEGRRAK